MSADLPSPFDQSIKIFNDYTNQRLQVLVRHSIRTNVPKDVWNKNFEQYLKI